MAGHGRPKGIAASKAQAKAGAANLKNYLSKVGQGMQKVTHGVYSSTIRQRYSDKRTTEGKMLESAISSIVSDLGGAGAINSAQNLILAGLRGKFIVIFQISAYLDKQAEIVNEEGHILPVLANNYLGYCESVRRDLESLYGMHRKTLNRKIKTIDQIVRDSR